MIRQFRPGVWIDPELVIGLTHSERHISVVLQQSHGPTGAGWYLHFPGGEELADEIGTAARIAQEARLAADTRLRSPIQCPECGSAERIGLAFGADGKSLEDCARRRPPPTWPADDAGRSE